MSGDAEKRRNACARKTRLDAVTEKHTAAAAAAARRAKSEASLKLYASSDQCGTRDATNACKKSPFN